MCYCYFRGKKTFNFMTFYCARPLLFSLLLLICFSHPAKAQFETFYSRGILERIKNGNTHVLVNDTSFPRAAEFLNVFKKNWTITKSVSFLKKQDLNENVIANDTYFILEPYRIEAGHSTVVIFTLNLFTPKDRAIKKGRKFRAHDEDWLAQIQLGIDRTAIGEVYVDTDMGQSFSFDFNGNKHIFNWSPGFLKSYLQIISAAITADKKISLTHEQTNKDQVASLKNQTIYINADDYRDGGIFTRDGHSLDTLKLFKDVKFKYRLISNEELDKKILDDKTPTFYLLSVLTGGCKMVSVINSQTGEQIYLRFTSATWNLKPGDLKDLSKQIEK